MKNLSKILLCLFIASLLVTGGLLSYSIHTNCKLRLEFEPKSYAYPYAEALENGEFNLELLTKTTFVGEHALIGSPPFEYNISSPVTIRYYSNPDDISPVFTVEKGDTIWCRPPSQSVYEGDVTYHGLESLPTDKRGWRLAKPFITKGKEQNDSLLYVKLSDLDSVCGEWLKENVDLIPFFKNTTPKERSRLQKEYLKDMPLYIDNELYERGSYLSPDLLTPVFSPASVVSLSVSVVSLAAYLILRRRVKKLNKQQKRLSL